MTSDGTKTYFWDAADRLTEVKQGAATLAAFTYDGQGRRATKAAGGVTTTYVYDGVQFLEERPSAGSTKRYAYGPGIDQPFAQVVGGTTTYNVADHLGSVVRTTDGLGSPTLTREYDPWGNPIQGSATSGYAFTGREWDAETGLYYYRARYYDSRLGRFTADDPIGSEGGLNLYAYCSGTPVGCRDPGGLKPGDKFKDRDLAVLDAYRYLVKEKRAELWKEEWGGRVCKTRDKDCECYVCTEPRTQHRENKVDVGQCGAGTENAGFYHTHPDNETFSDDDLNKAYQERVPGYVWLLDGRVLRYEWVHPGIPVQIGTVK